MNLKPLILVAGAVALFALYRRSYAAAQASSYALAFDPYTGVQYQVPIEEPYSIESSDAQYLIPEQVQGEYMSNAQYWKQGNSYPQYAATIAEAERSNGIPQDLLARLLYQESRFRDDIINGTVQSPAGAIGIAQIIPRWHPGVNPLDPIASIHYAAQYLRSHFNTFGNWKLALAAYNWGQGNLREQGIAAAPAETRNYITQITSDVPVT